MKLARLFQDYQAATKSTFMHLTLVAFGSPSSATNSALIFFIFPALILCKFIQKLGTTQAVTVHCLADTSLKIVPTNPQVPSEKYYTLPGIY